MPIIEYHHPIILGLALVCEIEYYPGDPGNPNPESVTCCPPESPPTGTTFPCNTHRESNHA